MPDSGADHDLLFAPRFDAGATGLHVPAVHQYFGLWAIDELIGRQLVSQMQGFDLAAHARQQLIQQTVIVDGAVAPNETLARRRADLRIVDNVALIDLAGSVMKYASSFSDSTSTVGLRQQIRAADRHPDVTQILLRIDSPGGTVPGVAEVYDDLRAASKPVTVYIEDLGASAAYWIASGAERIYANSAARIGSIGVFTLLMDDSQSAERLGLKMHLIATGPFKGLGAEGIPITDGQLAYVRTLVESTFERFQLAIQTGRKLSPDAVKAVADGRVWSAAEAQQLRLIDGVRSFDDLFAELRGSSKSPSRKERSTMTDSTKPAAATLAELKAACPGAPSEFLLQQLEDEATADAAAKAWSRAREEALRADLDKARTDLTKAQADLAAAKSDLEKARARPAGGLQPLADDAVDDDDTGAGDDAVTEYEAAVRRVGKERSLSHEQAASFVNRHMPALRQKYQAAMAAAWESGHAAPA